MSRAPDWAMVYLAKQIAHTHGISTGGPKDMTEYQCQQLIELLERIAKALEHSVDPFNNHLNPNRDPLLEVEDAGE